MSAEAALEPADPGRYSGLADVPPSAAHTTPWPRPRLSRGLWPEARWSEGAAPPSRPCRTGTAAPEPKRSDDPPHAPWFASASHGASVYPQPQPSGIPADPFSRRPYDTLSHRDRGLTQEANHLLGFYPADPVPLKQPSQRCLAQACSLG